MRKESKSTCNGGRSLNGGEPSQELGDLEGCHPQIPQGQMGSRAEVAECLRLKPCWEGRVPSASTISGRMSHSRIFTAGQRDGAVRALLAWFPCRQDQDYDGALPNCRDVNSGDREVEELH